MIIGAFEVLLNMKGVTSTSFVAEGHLYTNNLSSPITSMLITFSRHIAKHMEVGSELDFHLLVEIPLNDARPQLRTTQPPSW